MSPTSYQAAPPRDWRTEYSRFLAGIFNATALVNWTARTSRFATPKGSDKSSGPAVAPDTAFEAVRMPDTARAPTPVMG